MLISKNIVNSSAVDDFIKNSGCKLPDDYKFFLIKYNGGETPNTSLKTQNDSLDVRAFYGVGKVPYSLDTVSTMDKNGNVYLPIAIDSFGNCFVIDTTGDTGVFFVDHEKNREMRCISNSFKSFVSLCKSEPIKESAKRSPEEREQLMIKKGKAKNITENLRKMWQNEYKKYSKMVQEEVVI